MPITKTVVLDKLEILGNGVIQIRMVTTAFDDDGTVIGERFFRTILIPGQDVSAQPNKIQRICAIIWDAQTIANYQANSSRGLP